MKLQHLRFFTAVVECGGVIKASERLHISQPAVSAGIKALEEELGGTLFDRSTSRKLTLTPAGRRFYRQAQEILERCDSALAQFDADGRVRRIRLGVLDTVPQVLVPGLVEGVMARRPEWQIEVWEGSVQRLLGWLGQGRIDLALTRVHGEAEGERPLWTEALVAVVPPGHRFAGRASIPLSELQQEPFIHRSRCELDPLGRARLRAAGVTLPVVVRGEREGLVFELVRRGRGITLAPQGLVPSDLVAVAVSGLGVHRTVGLQWLGDGEGDVIDTVAEVLLERRSGAPVACGSGAEPGPPE